MWGRILSTAGDALSKTLSSKPVPNVQKCRINPTLSHGYLQKKISMNQAWRSWTWWDPRRRRMTRERERERETWFLLLGLESFITLAWQQAFLAEVELPQGIAGFHGAPGRTQERSSEESESDGHGSGKYAHTKQTPNADFLTPPSLHYCCQTDR